MYGKTDIWKNIPFRRVGQYIVIYDNLKRRGSTVSDVILELKDILKSFHGVLALDSINFELKTGKVQIWGKNATKNIH